MLMLLNPTLVAADTIFVVPGGGGDFTTIQAAVNGAAAGDTIQIAVGTYPESVDLSSGPGSLTFVGAAAGVIIASSDGPAFFNSVPMTGDFTFDNLTLSADGGVNEDGIRLAGVTGAVQILNSTFTSIDDAQIFIIGSGSSSTTVYIDQNHFSNGSVAPTDAINLESNDASMIQATISNNVVSISQQPIEIDADDTSTMVVALSANTLHSSGSATVIDVQITAGFAPTVNVSMVENTISSDHGDGIKLQMAGGAAAILTALIEKNQFPTIGSSSGDDAIFLQGGSGGAGTAQVNIIDNVFGTTGDIWASAISLDGATATTTWNLLIQDNQLVAADAGGVGSGIRIESAASTVNLAMLGNSIGASFARTGVEMDGTSGSITVEDSFSSGNSGPNTAQGEVVDNNTYAGGGAAYTETGTVHFTVRPPNTPVILFNETVAEAEDFASLAFADPWDMDSIQDIYNEKTQHAMLSIQDGLLVGQSVGGTPQLWLLWPGFTNKGTPGYDQDPVEDGWSRYGSQNPIDGDHYRYLIVRLYVDTVQPGDGGRVFWARENDLTPFGLSKPFFLQPGWHTYTIDLQSVGIDGGTETWGGALRALRLDPTNRSGVNFKIDWVRLVPENGSTAQIEWSGLTDGLVSLYAVTDPVTLDKSIPIVERADAQAGNAIWPASRFAPDLYYIHQVSGVDYATFVRGDAWDLAEATDLSNTPAGPQDLNNLTVQNGVLRAVTGRDPQFFLPLASVKPDPTVFTHFSFRMRVRDMASQAGVYWQLFWFTDDATGTTGLVDQQPPADDITGWRTYSVDLSNDTRWTGASGINFLRLDPVSGAHMVTRTIEIDWIGLTSRSVLSESELANNSLLQTRTVTVQQAPMARITAPSWTSGQDYAGVVRGDDWGMDQLSDAPDGRKITQRSVQDGILTALDDPSGSALAPPRGCVTRESDPAIWLHTKESSDDLRTPIDPLRYRYLSYRFTDNSLQDPCKGSAHRMVAAAFPGFATNNFGAVITNEGWNTYNLDLAQVGSLNQDWLELGGNPANSLTVLGLQPNGIPDRVVTNQVDYVKLTSRPWADRQYAIRWQLLAATEPATATLFYEPVPSANVVSATRTQIGSTNLADGWLLWDTSSVAPGEYRVSLQMDDGLSLREVMSPVSVVVKRQPTLAFHAFSPTIFQDSSSPKIKTLSWTLVYPDADNRIELSIEPVDPIDDSTDPITISQKLPGNQTTFDWTIDGYTPGTYRLFATIDDHLSPLRRIPYGQFIQIKDGGQRRSASAPDQFQGQRDSGLRPQANGYAFANYSVSSSTLNDPATVETLIQMFGSDAVCKPGTVSQDGRACALDANMRAMLTAILGDGYGQGYGMAVTALRFFHGLETPTSLGLASNNVATLARGGALDNHLFRYALQQYTEPVSGGNGWERNLDIAEVVNRIGAELDPDTRTGDPYLLVLHDGASSLSLTLVPYRRQQLEVDLYDLYVYDPNLPLDNERAIRFDTAQQSWQYASQLPANGQPVTLTGGPAGGHVDLRRLSAHQPTGLHLTGATAAVRALRAAGFLTAQQPTAFLVEGCFSVSGGAALENNPDANGACETGGNETVYCLRVADGLGAKSGLMACGVLPTGGADNYNFALHPNAQGQSSLTLLTESGPVVTLKSAVAAGQGVTPTLGVTVSPGLDKVSVTPDQTGGAQVEMTFAYPGTQNGDASYTVQVGGQTGQGQSLTAQVTGATGQLNLETANPSSYQLSVEQLTGDGSINTFENPAVQVAGPAAQVDYGSWQGGQDGMEILVDDEGDGFADETPAEISNEFGKLYLPIMLR